MDQGGGASIHWLVWVIDELQNFTPADRTTATRTRYSPINYTGNGKMCRARRWMATGPLKLRPT
ncbi:hypothetical protein E2C01_030811 [Portunus trituberculatus]|uniref:Uncharacterized protein n=1 Tax=Portunus trituberculatus TaxID=210409 RepID=A0A5B7EVW3_PORTR|nr:hypothetical protein [Portunus trituberculatus]